MSPIGFIFMLCGLLVMPFAVRDRSKTRIAVFMIVFVLHCVSTLIYFDFVQTNDADTKFYYFDEFGFYDKDFAVGTQFVIVLTQIVRNWTGGTYLDLFYFYSTIGFWGLGMLMRAIEEVFASAETEQPPLAYALVFLPGLYFWTSMIGKDAPLFLGCSLAVWAALDIGKRAPAFAAAVAITFLFRPHIALMMAATLALSIVLIRDVRTGTKILIGAASLFAVFFFMPTLQSTLNVDVGSSASVGNFLESQRSAIAQLDGGGTTDVNAIYPVRLFSLLFRPLFFDATSFMGLAASFENVAMLLIVGFIVRNGRLLIALSRRFLYLRFAAIFLLLLIVSLSLVWYNVGLGLRQRTMYVPALCVVAAALMATRQVQRQAAQAARARAWQVAQWARRHGQA